MARAATVRDPMGAMIVVPSMRKAGAATHALADAGWHCTFCFRTLAEYQFKLRAYAHEDRSAPRHRAAAAIQRRLCAGEDLGEMLPEVFTFKDLVRFADWGVPERSFSAVALPRHVAAHPARFRFLLPGAGNCVRSPGEGLLLSPPDPPPAHHEGLQPQTPDPTDRKQLSAEG